MSYVCFNITSRCNMECPYCYRVGNTYGSVNFEKAKEYIDFLVDQGCRTINITGGEPLLNSHWKSIIKYCYEKGLFVILSTNGLQLDLQDEVLQYINVLSLPLDGGSAEVNNKTRSEGHFEKIVLLLNEYINGEFSFGLKVNTVLTGYNQGMLQQILELLDSPLIVWKIFELREKGEFYNFPKDQMIDTEIAKQAVSAIYAKDHECSIYFMGKHVEKSAEYTVNPNYIVLNYNGDLYIADETKNKLLLNLNDDAAGDRVRNAEVNLLNNQYYEELSHDFERD